MDSEASFFFQVNRRAWPIGGRLDYWIAPDGWKVRRYQLGSGDRGRMMVIGGRGDMIEKYLEPISHWANRGWAVTSFDWRGQGGSGRLAPDPMCGHIEDFSQWIDDLDDLNRGWKEQGKGPSVMVAHSMGGFLLLRALVEKAVDPAAVALVSPMLGINTGPLPSLLAEAMATMMCQLGFAEKQAWTQEENSLRQRRVRQRRLTHDPDRYADELFWRDHNRDIAIGSPSWNWVRQALRSTRLLEKNPALEQMSVPVLILAASGDELVSSAAIKRIVPRLSNAALQIYGPEAAHEILREMDQVRLDAYSRIDRFFDEVAV